MNCTDCHNPIDKYQPNGRDPLCPDCRKLRRRERSRTWKDNNPEKVKANWRENYHKRKYTQEPRYPCKPQRGVEILYRGRSQIDHMSKTAFEHYRKDFEPGDQYKIDGVWRTI